MILTSYRDCGRASRAAAQVFALANVTSLVGWRYVLQSECLVYGVDPSSSGCALSGRQVWRLVGVVWGSRLRANMDFYESSRVESIRQARALESGETNKLTNRARALCLQLQLHDLSGSKGT